MSAIENIISVIDFSQFLCSRSFPFVELLLASPVSVIGFGLMAEFIVGSGDSGAELEVSSEAVMPCFLVCLRGITARVVALFFDIFFFLSGGGFLTFSNCNVRGLG